MAWPFRKNLNPYNENLYKEFNSEVIEFSWKKPLRNVDLFHVHWPETYLGSDRFVKYVFGSLAVLLVLLWYRMIGIPVVWSVHNTQPHNSRYKFLNKAFYKYLHFLVTHYLVMNEFQLENYPSEKVALLRHGMRFKTDRSIRPNTKEKYCLMFGSIANYKNHLEVFDLWRTNKFSMVLNVVGWCNDKSYLNDLKASAKSILSINIVSEYVSEDTLNHYIDNSCAVIVNYSRNNSGVIYKAIERGTKVLVRNTKFSQELVSQFPQSVIPYDDINSLTEEILVKENTEISFYNKEYDWDIVSRRCEKLLVNVINSY